MPRHAVADAADEQILGLVAAPPSHDDEVGAAILYLADEALGGRADHDPQFCAHARALQQGHDRLQHGLLPGTCLPELLGWIIPFGVMIFCDDVFKYASSMLKHVPGLTAEP